MTTSAIASRAANLSLRLIEEMDKAEDVETFTRLDKIAGRALQLLSGCGRVIQSPPGSPGLVGSLEQQEAA